MGHNPLEFTPKEGGKSERSERVLYRVKRGRHRNSMDWAPAGMDRGAGSGIAGIDRTPSAVEPDRGK